MNWLRRFRPFRRLRRNFGNPCRFTIADAKRPRVSISIFLGGKKVSQ